MRFTENGPTPAVDTVAVRVMLLPILAFAADRTMTGTATTLITFGEEQALCAVDAESVTL